VIYIFFKSFTRDNSGLIIVKKYYNSLDIFLNLLYITVYSFYFMFFSIVPSINNYVIYDELIIMYYPTIIIIYFINKMKNIYIISLYIF
jgi:hypothetical protein